MNCTDPNNPTLIERKAIAQLKAGDIEGLSQLVQLYQTKAVQAAALITTNFESAQEIVQDTFLLAYKKIHLFDENRPFSPWFMRCVINAARDEARRQRRFSPLEMDEDQEQARETWRIDPKASVEEIIEGAETVEMVQQALRQLSPEQRTVIVMSYFLDQNQTEMMRQLDKPLSTIKWHLRSAREKLRKLIQSQSFRM